MFFDVNFEDGDLIIWIYLNITKFDIDRLGSEVFKNLRVPRRNGPGPFYPGSAPRLSPVINLHKASDLEET